MTNKEVMQMALDVLTNKRYAPSIKETTEALRAALAQPEPDAVLAEREACARLCETKHFSNPVRAFGAEDCAEAIRARKKTHA